MKKFTFFVFALLFFLILHFTFNIEHCQAQWVQQTVPISGGPYDMVFFDANTGIMSNDAPALFRTTNGGINWVVHKDHWQISIMQKIDSTCVYAVGRYLLSTGGYGKIYRTYDKGLTWDSVSESSNNAYKSYTFINRDTGWISGFDGYNDLLWKTTNGGITIFPLTYSVGWGTLYMYREPVNGYYIGWHSTGVGTKKTTDGGVTWFTSSSSIGIGCTYFLNKDTGWTTCASCIYKTFDGGYNWTLQPMPSGNPISYNGIGLFCVANKNILYGMGGYINLGGGRTQDIIYKTTNGGINWGYQLPDTSIYFGGSQRALCFIDSIKGWAYSTGNVVIHTTVGGGPIIYTKINNNSQNTIKLFELYQNYPNPFNSTTNIKVQMLKRGYAEIKIYDITGKLNKILVKQNLNSGTHNFKFNFTDFTSGVYFYSLFVDGIRVDTKRMLLIK